MSIKKTKVRWPLVLAVWLTHAWIQTGAANPSYAHTALEETAEMETVNPSLEELRRWLAQQSEEIKALRQQVAEQSERLKRMEQRAETAVPVAATPQPMPGNGVAPVSATTAPGPAAPPQTGAPAAQSLKAEPAKSLGPFRFGGDLRFRFDVGTRATGTLPDGDAIPGAQSIRMRYRLRLSFDTDLNEQIGFHGQLASGQVNDGQTEDQDFGAALARHPFFINEAWIDYHPHASLAVQGGRVQEIFSDDSRFLFDNSARFNGFNEKFTRIFKTPILKLNRIELRAGQYNFSNPNVAVVVEGSPLARAGARVGSRGRAAQLFHQGFVAYQTLSEKWDQEWGADIQLYRNPNQIALASTSDGVALIVEGPLGLRLSGPMAGAGTATTTPGGAMFTAPHFQIARVAYTLNYKALGQTKPRPLALNIQLARNVGTAFERDALMATLSFGQTKNRGDWRVFYVYSIKGANSMIAQLTDNELGTNTQVNLRVHHVRFDIKLAKGITFQSLAFFQHELRSSGQFPNFFVPLGAATPLQLRLLQNLLFSF